MEKQTHAQWTTSPNVIVILLDDVGISNISAYGGNYSTPEIDDLAANGMMFTEGRAESVCTPSRCALLSGDHPERTRCIDNNHYYKYATTTYGLPKAMQDAGYATAVVGKWQLGDNRMIDTAQECSDFGWDHCYVWQQGQNRYWSGVFVDDGTTVNLASNEFGPDFMLADAIDWIDNQTGSFFLYYPMSLVHDEGGAWTVPPGSTASNNAEKYNDMVEYADYLIGALMDHLSTAGIDDETLVLLVGDNGPHCGASIVRTIGGTEINGCKSSREEGGVRVPYLAYWPGVIASGTSDQAVTLEDIWPTLAEITGAPMNAVYDGESFARILAGGYQSPKSWAYVQQGEATGDHCAVIGKRVKVYCDGSCVGMPALFSETSTSGDECDDLESEMGDLLTNMGVSP